MRALWKRCGSLWPHVGGGVPLGEYAVRGTPNRSFPLCGKGSAPARPSQPCSCLEIEARKGKDAARLLHLGIVICAGPAVSSALIR